MADTLYLVRHCESSGQEPDAPLTRDGHAQAISLSRTLQQFGIEYIVSSPYLRAQQSAEPFAKAAGLKLNLDERLKERVLSPNPLPDWREHIRQSYDDLDYALPGGESGRDTMQRGRAVIDSILQMRAKTAAVFSHGNWLTLNMMSFDPGYGYDDWQNLSNPDIFRLTSGSNGFAIARCWPPE